jgi:hypothetical protein
MKGIVIKDVAIVVIRAYQAIISPLLPPNSCRFYPSCSQYAIDAVSKHGSARGLLLAIKRVGKCHPYHPGGYDPA